MHMCMLNIILCMLWWGVALWFVRLLSLISSCMDMYSFFCEDGHMKSMHLCFWYILFSCLLSIMRQNDRIIFPSCSLNDNMHIEIMFILCSSYSYEGIYSIFCVLETPFYWGSWIVSQYVSNITPKSLWWDSCPFWCLMPKGERKEGDTWSER